MTWMEFSESASTQTIIIISFLSASNTLVGRLSRVMSHPISIFHENACDNSQGVKFQIKYASVIFVKLDYQLCKFLKLFLRF